MSTSSSSASLRLLPEHEENPSPPEGHWSEVFELVRPIDSGGYAQVSLVRRRRTGEELALKVLEKTSARDRFRREIEEQKRAQHPNVMPIRDYGHDWYAMPLAIGTLKNLAGELSDDERVQMARDVALGLAHAHKLKLVHRDVSPNNIMRLTDDDGTRWVIADFGFVRRPPGQTTGPSTHGPVGTAGFAAPEVFILGAHQADARADIYSLGRVLGYALTGYWPLAEEQIGGIPAEWVEIIEFLTCRAVSDRLQSLDEFAGHLAEVEMRLRASRRQRWSQPSEPVVQSQAQLSPAEIAVLGQVLDLGSESFTEHRLFEATKRRMRRREITLGLLALQERGFLEGVVGEHCSEWALSKLGRAWAIRNQPALLGENALNSSPALPEVSGGEDDIPF
jgi:serine/threonine protein kinase